MPATAPAPPLSVLFSRRAPARPLRRPCVTLSCCDAVPPCRRPRPAPSNRAVRSRCPPAGPAVTPAGPEVPHLRRRPVSSWMPVDRRVPVGCRAEQACERNDAAEERCGRLTDPACDRSSRRRRGRVAGVADGGRSERSAPPARQGPRRGPGHVPRAPARTGHRLRRRPPPPDPVRPVPRWDLMPVRREVGETRPRPETCDRHHEPGPWTAASMPGGCGRRHRGVGAGTGMVAARAWAGRVLAPAAGQLARPSILG